MGGWGLRFAITIAVLWAGVVFGTYLTMILFIGPFNNWSASQQMQLFQSMVGLAGFGGGGVALFFAAQQISHLYARPLLEVRFRALDPSGNAYLQAEPEDDPEEFRTTIAANLRLYVEVTNRGATICPAWRVDLLVPGAANMSPGRYWQRVTDRDHVSRQAREDEALYPDSPLPIGHIEVDTQGIARPSVLKLTAKIVTEHRVSARYLTIHLLAEAPSDG